MEPESLLAFVVQLEEAGFERSGENRWEGPTHPALVTAGFTTSLTMSVVIVAAWPYQPPLLHVPELDAWHADRELLCIWEDEDNTQRWTTVAGMNARIEEWVAAATTGFMGAETARNPEIYWRGAAAGCALIDLDELVGNAGADGQHEEFHFVRLADASDAAGIDIFDVVPGGFGPVRPGPAAAEDYRRYRARWFYRDQVDRPPRNLDEFRAQLTANQITRLDKDLRDRPIVMFGLIWRNAAGLVCTMLLSWQAPEEDERTYAVVRMRPKGPQELLLRAGPDAATLQEKRIVIVGAGAIGSHVADTLTRAGIGHTVLYDHDRLWPANLIRHAAPPDSLPGVTKTRALSDHLGRHPWSNVEGPPSGHSGSLWHPEAIAGVARSTDLLIDATGHAGFSELAARIALSEDCPYISVALFRGGTVARVRRQAHEDDAPLLARPHLDRCPAVPPLPDELEYVGTETGCLSRVHNAPPTSVAFAAASAANIAIDALLETFEYPDEVIDVLRGGGDRPFDRVGRIRPDDLEMVVDVAESAADTILDAAERAQPLETGGVLIGTTVDERTVVAAAIELTEAEATTETFTVPHGKVADAVEAAREADARLGYVGEWHTHPAGGGVSSTDRATMMTVAADADVTNPILLVAHPDGENWSIEAVVATPETIRPITVEACGDLPEDGAVGT